MPNNPILQYYDQLAPDYDHDRFGNSYGRFIDSRERAVLAHLLPRHHGGVVLDLACGSGRLLDFADFGVDASSEMVAIARQKHPNKTIHVADAAHIPLADGSVDTIISFHLFMHLDWDKIHAILAECHRVLRNGGRVIFDVPSADRRRLLRHQPQGWHGAFSASVPQWHQVPGFSVGRTFGVLFLPIHRFPAAIRPLLTRLDAALCGSFLKAYSSYLIIEFQKDDLR